MWENLGTAAGTLFGNTTGQKCPSARLMERTEGKGQEGKSHCTWGGTGGEWVQGMFPMQMLQGKIQSKGSFFLNPQPPGMKKLKRRIKEK